ncbi:MAG: SpoIIE family protein phosphatase [Solirubrobacteraceae bacterium]
MNHERERLELLELFYQCPVGLVEIDDAGAVRKINPAAARILNPAVAGDDLGDVLGVLRRLAPDLADEIEHHPERLGRLGGGRRVVVPSGRDRDPGAELRAVRVQFDRVMIVLVDIAAEDGAAQREHRIAAELHRSMLGRIDPTPSLAVGVTHVPAVGRPAGGDWYDAVALGGDRTALLVGDVGGAQLRAIAAMGQLRSAVRAVAPAFPDPAQLLARADALADEIDGAGSATIACGVLDARTGALAYARAGHPPPLVLGAHGAASLLAGADGPALGPGRPPRSTAHARLSPGDTLVMYTDGLPGGDDPVERERRLTTVASRLHHLPVDALGEQLARDMLAGGPATGDVCILVARRAG